MMGEPELGLPARNSRQPLFGRKLTFHCSNNETYFGACPQDALGGRNVDEARPGFAGQGKKGGEYGSLGRALPGQSEWSVLGRGSGDVGMLHAVPTA